jgi:hypothetical protein
MGLSDWIAIVAVLIALGALGVAIYQMKIATLTMSSQIYMSAMESLSVRWLELKKTDQGGHDADIKYHGAELLNRLEVVCLLYRTNAFRGKIANDVKIWLLEQISVIQLYSKLMENFPDLLSSETTFDNINWFIKNIKPQHIK